MIIHTCMKNTYKVLQEVVVQGRISGMEYS